MIGASAVMRRLYDLVEPAALAALVLRPWPGNVRELENVVTQMIVLSTRDVVEEADLPVLLPQRLELPPPIERARSLTAPRAMVGSSRGVDRSAACAPGLARPGR